MQIPFTDFMVSNFAGEDFSYGNVCFSYGGSRFFITEVTSSAVKYGVQGYSLSATGYVILGATLHRRVLGNRCVIKIDDEAIFT